MTENNSNSDGIEGQNLAIEGKLPLKAVGIENLKEANPKHMPPHRYLHPWFARRPTPAARLATLASILPEGVDSDQILSWIQIGPKEGIEGDISEYVEKKKASEGDRSGSLGEHYGYPRPFTQSPNKKERRDIHEILEETWDGELPTVLDPCAGGGVIPYEAIRYGLPTKANELNPVPSVILQVLLNYAPRVGSLKDDLEQWSQRIDDLAEERLEQYFPSEGEHDSVDSYVCAHVVTCPDCGTDIPLVSKWSIRTRRSADTVISVPEVAEDGSIGYDCLIEPTEEELDEFDHKQGTVSRGGDAECLNCGIVTESEDIVEMHQEGDFSYDIICVRYMNSSGNYSFRAPNEADYEALTSAEQRIESDFDLASFLTTPLPEGQKTREPREHGINEWRDMFTPRQLVSHYEYYRSFEDKKDEIKEEYPEGEAEALLTVLSLVPGKLVDYNSRFSPWHTGKGYPSNAMGGKHLSLAKSFADINMSVGGMGSYQSAIRKIIESYEELVSYLPDDASPAELSTGDAASLPYSDNEIEAVVIDPPYYSSIMYAELSDMFYVWMKEYLDDVYPDQFQPDLTNKDDEAVANPSRFEGIAGGSDSKRELANNEYEQKMSEIFSELYRVLKPGGVMTVMFTHKETDAWDTLTKSLINSGFTITSTHPISSEMPARIDTQDSGSADSTLLLTGRKTTEGSSPIDSDVPTLWSDVRADTRLAAKDAARDLLDSGLSLTKTDVIISAFGPTLKVYADAYPVVDDQDEPVPPRRALEEAREAVTQILVDEYLEGGGLGELDDITEWYVLSWLVHESDTFNYDEGHQLGLGIGVDIDEIKRSTKLWRKRRGDIKLRGYDDRVQDITLPKEERSNRKPVDPDAISFTIALDAVHAAMHVYAKQGEDVAIDWLKERNFDTDAPFKATLKALLQVLPQDHPEWEAARDLALGRTHDALGLEFTPTDFTDVSEDRAEQTELGDHA